MALDKKYLENVVNRFYRVIKVEYDKGGYERALSSCCALAALLYQSNQYYYDHFIETTLCNISKNILKDTSKNVKSALKNPNINKGVSSQI